MVPEQWVLVPRAIEEATRDPEVSALALSTPIALKAIDLGASSEGTQATHHSEGRQGAYMGSGGEHTGTVFIDRTNGR